MMRDLDHFVMPVSSLAVARGRLTALGFTVSPDARHPFGTENCCVFMSDGSFIEPLAIGDEAAYIRAIDAENTFVKGHHNFCAARNSEGFSHLVVKSSNARADHAEFIKSGISGGDIVDFGRKFVKADGTDAEVAFSLAFAREPNSPDTTFFACQVVKSVPGGRGALVEHANGALRTKRVLILAHEPKRFAGFLGQFFKGGAADTSGGITFSLPGGNVDVLEPDASQDKYGLVRKPDRGMHLSALVLQVADLTLTRDLLAKNSVSVQDRQNRIIVPPSLQGQGGTIVFEE